MQRTCWKSEALYYGTINHSRILNFNFKAGRLCNIFKFTAVTVRFKTDLILSFCIYVIDRLWLLHMYGGVTNATFL